MKEMYILFTADFDERESFVQYFNSKEDLLQFIEGWDDKDMYKSLIKRGFYESEWWNFHLVKVNKHTSCNYN